LQTHLVYLLVRGFVSLIRFLPRSLATHCLDFLATIAFCVDAGHRHIAQVNLAIAFPELPERERDGIALRSFRNTARNLLEVSRLPSLTTASIRSLVRYDAAAGLNNYELARAKGKGILYLTGHFSAWELLPAAHALYGYPLSYITRPLDNPRLERYLQQVRESSGNSVVPKKSSARWILEKLKAGGSVGILMDQNTSLQEGVFADLFGVPAATTSGLALFALRTDAPILPGYLTPMQDGMYTIKFRPPIELERTGDRNRDLAEGTRRLNLVVESIIREQPDSWLWGHKRWKNQPPGNPQDLYALSRKELEEFVRKCAASAGSRRT
jgi:KDO2-lipid IV(A) lauroyltransferase